MEDDLNHLQRGYCTDFLKHQTEAVSKLEGLQETLDADSVAERELIKIQHELINLQNRFSRLVYLSGEVYSNE